MKRFLADYDGSDAAAVVIEESVAVVKKKA